MFPNYVESVNSVTTVGADTGTDPVTGATQNPALGDGASAGNTGAWNIDWNTYTTPGDPIANDGIETVGQHANISGPMSSASIAYDKNKEAISGLGQPYALYDARYLQVFPNYAYNNGTANVGSFVIGKKHTMTLDFFDKNGQKLNTLKISYTPVLPELSDMFVKEDGYWNADQTVLKAYYKAPDNWFDAKFYGVDTDATPLVSTAFWGGDSDNITMYNVYNPGGVTDLDHTRTTPLDGGYKKIALRTDVDKRWVDEVSLALKNKALEIGGAHALNTPLLGFLGNAAFGPGMINGTTGANTVIWLNNQTNEFAGVTGDATYLDNFVELPKEEPNAYGKTLDMIWDLSPYIGYYTIDGTEEFKLQIQSAIDKAAGASVVGTKAIVEDAAPGNGQFAQLTDEHITLKNYNNQDFSIFKVWNATRASAVYEYTYIYRVEFSRPEGVSVYDIMTPVDPAALEGLWEQNNDGVSAIEPTADVASYVAIRPNNIETTTPTHIIVKVYDRFGRTIEEQVPITINRVVATPAE
jgi:hypothetical protein